MSEPMKLKIGLARFPYAGNGGFQSEHPAVGTWMAGLTKAVDKDPRCQPGMYHFCEGDTPIPMMRNLACFKAIRAGVDVLIMIDSDTVPDLYAGHDPTAKKFWDSSFEFLYEHHAKGPCVVMAPYGGPPPDPVLGGSENMYMFRWRTKRNDPDAPMFSLEQFTREEAAAMGGISEVAAGPTGLVMIDLRCLSSHLDPAGPNETWERLDPPWFFYEYPDDNLPVKYQIQKCSTEDVVFTRNLSMIGVPQFTNWDAWAGHYKPYLVGKPMVITPEFVRKQYRAAILRGGRQDEKLVEIGAGKSTEEIVGDLGLQVVAVEVAGNGEGQSGDELLVPHEDGTAGVGHMTSQEDLEILQGLVRKVVGAHTDRALEILEIGSWVGESALAIAEALGSRESIIQAGHTIHCVDTWEGSAHDMTGAWAQRFSPDRLFELFKKNCGDLYGTVIFPHRGRSPKALETLLDDAFDLIFIDAGHAEHETGADVDAALPKLRKDGFSIFCGHDWSHDFPGVKRAVRARFPAEKIQTAGNLWWVEFPAEKEAVAQEQMSDELLAMGAAQAADPRLVKEGNEDAVEAIYAKYDREREAHQNAQQVSKEAA